jgi:uncharacterized protein YcaQ
MHRERVRLSSSEARRVALAAQGFDRPRPSGKVDIRHFRRVLTTVGALQLDYVNVLIPAHFLTVWSRLGGYDKARFAKFVYGHGEFAEQWAHEASIVPSSYWPMLGYRRRDYVIRPYNPLQKLPDRRRYLRGVLELVRHEGAVTAQDIPARPGPKRRAGDWHRSVARWALEFHFARGDLAVADRLPNFQRVYDLPERVIPERYLGSDLESGESRRELLRKASLALGVATLHDLADYYRMPARDAAPYIADLVEAGQLQKVDVENWADEAYLSTSARIPRHIGGASLLSPFDPIMWCRPRVARLFEFHYRIEIYVPAAQRQWGYYVLPFRMGDRIVARVDLKADRKRKRLLVLRSHVEDGIDQAECVDKLVDELRKLTVWLDLEKIFVTKHGPFSRGLSAALGP